MALDKVYALNGKTGAKKWEFVRKDVYKQIHFGNPVIGLDGTVYIGSVSDQAPYEKKIYALNGSTGILRSFRRFTGHWG